MPATDPAADQHDHDDVTFDADMSASSIGAETGEVAVATTRNLAVDGSSDDLRHLSPADIAALVKKLDDIDKTMHWLESHLFFRAHRGWLSVFFFQLTRGLALGLGSVLGATVVLYGVMYFLTHIDFIPIIGNWADQLVNVLTENDLARTYVENLRSMEVAEPTSTTTKMIGSSSVSEGSESILQTFSHTRSSAKP